MAAQVIVVEGIDALTMPHLARQLDAAVGALYRYFDSKDALLAAMQIRAIGRFEERLVLALAAADDPVAEVRTAWVSWRTFAAEEAAMHGLIDAGLSAPQPLLDDDKAESVQRALDPVLARVTDALRRAQADGSLSKGDPVLRTYALWAALHGVDHFRKRDPRLAGDLASDRVAEVLLETLLTGWGQRVAERG